MDATAVSRHGEGTIESGDSGQGDLDGRRGALRPALAALPARQRDVLSLRYLAGLNDLEVSEALGLSVRAVRKHAARGDAALRSRGVIPDGVRG